MLKTTLLSFILALFLFNYNLNAQNIRFIYIYKSVQDTLQKDSITKEIMVLEINPKNGNSIFSSLKKIISDSTMTDSANKSLYAFPDRTIVTKYIIEKKDKNVFFYTANHTITPVLKVVDKRPFQWKIYNENAKILNYKVNKATTKFGGRIWTAWYSNVLSFTDGPYKFNGLPGLILKISDDSQNHQYELIAIEKTYQGYYDLLNSDNSYISSIPITVEKYKAEYNKDKNDPMRDIKQKELAGDLYFNSETEKNDYLRQTEYRLKMEAAKDNNPIELDLLK